MRMSFRPHRTPSGIALACTGLLASLAFVSPIPAAVRVLESDDRHVVVEITPPPPDVLPAPGDGRSWLRLEMPGLGHTGDLGRPEVPVGGFRVALPPGAAPRLRVLSEEWSADEAGALRPVPRREGVREPLGMNVVVEDLPREGPEYRAEAVYPPVAFRLVGTKGLRDLRVAEVEYAGARALTRTDRHRVLKRAVVQIEFIPEATRATAHAARPAQRTTEWDRTVRSNVVNAALARGWARGGPGDAASVGNTPWGAGDQWKIEVNATGLAEVSFATLAAAGFPAGVPIGQVALYQRTFDLDEVENPAVAAADLFVALPVPALARDRNGNGTFDAGDGLLFWGRSVRDQWMTSGYEHEDLFEARNFIWVRIDPAGGARMTARAGAVPTAPDVLPSTPYRVHRENDAQYSQYPPDHGPGRDAFESEFYYWNSHRTSTDGLNGWPLTDAFTVQDPVPGSAATLTARVCPTGQGAATRFHLFTNACTFSVNGTQVGSRTFYNNSLYSGGVVPPANVLNTYTVPAGVLAAGSNTFGFVGVSYQGSSPNPALVAFVARFLFDWYQVEYARQLVARGGQLLLSTDHGAAAPVSITVTGFDGTDLLLLDLTDPAAPVSIALVPGQVTPGGGGTFNLAFGHDNTGGTGRYLAARESSARAVAAGEITRVAPSVILAGGGGVRWLGVAADELADGARELSDHRAGRMSAALARASEVWDTFQNGARSPRAIKAFAAYGVHRWSTPLEFLCLIGDASEDHRGIGVDSRPDLMPSHSLWTDYEGAPEETDQYYAEVTSDGLGNFDDLADLYVGRLSVDTAAELAWNVRRIRAYETENPDQPWRRKVLLTADDALSGDLGAGLGAGYGWKGFLETQFCARSRGYADSLAKHPADVIATDVMCLSDFTHPCADSCNAPLGDIYPYDCETLDGLDCGIWYDCRIAPSQWANEYPCVVDAVELEALPVLRQKLNAGGLVWNYQGHANKFQLAHEYMFRDDNFPGGRRDVLSLDNDARPFIFLGFACHLAEFDRADERNSEDCLGEKLMNVQAPDQAEPGGCVAVFASSGFEFLSQNLSFNQYVMDAFFYPEKAAPGAALPDDGSAGYVWTLGESTTRARLMFQQEYPSAGTSRQAAQRFILLGDPALSPDLGSPSLAVTVNGRAVETPSDPYFVTPDDTESTFDVVVTATDGRGIVATRVVDTARGELAEGTDYERAVATQTPDGVPQAVTLTATVDVRLGEVYDVRFEAVDTTGKTSAFVLSTDTLFRFLDRPAVFPNPFRDRASIAFKATAAVRGGSVDIYTVGGRRVRSVRVGSLPSNEQHAVEWDGRDDNGLLVANGTYLARVSLDSAAGSAEETLPIVVIR